MKEDRERPAALGYGVTKPDILAEVERGETEAATAGHYGQHRSPRPRTAPTGPPQGTEVKSEEGVSPPPASPPSHRTGPGCSFCGVPEPRLNPGASNGGFLAPPPPLETRCRRSAEPPLECTECGRGFYGHKPDLVRHRQAHGGDGGYACGRCGRGFAEPVGLGGASSPCRAPPGTGRSPGTAEGGAAAAPPPKERKELSLPEKVRVLEMLEGPKVSQSELAKRFGVSQPQICRIIKNKERILSEWHRSGQPEHKRKREGKEDAALEAALLRWVEGARTTDLPGTGSLLQLKAKHLAQAQALGQPDPPPGGGWLARFGARQGKKPPAEKGDAEQPTAECWAGAVLPGLLRSYAPSEIYVCGETGVPLPTGSPGKGESAGDRLALLLCANADGSEKVPLRAVGESPRPRCLRGVNLGQMPWSYRGGGGVAGVTAPLFAEWLREFNEGMQRRGKSVLLLLAKEEARPYLQLSNVRMVFVPPAITLDGGIANDLKGHYRRRCLRWPPAERGAGQPTLLDALHTLAQAWGDVRPGLIASCFRAAGFSPDAGPEAPTLTPASGPLGQEELGRDGEPADGDEGTSEGEEAGEPVQPCPTEREVWGSLATLRRYLECRATSPDLFQAFYELEDAVHMVAAITGPALMGDTPLQQ
ncbi:PREDICTED: tigger transposable element-derived protein 3-like isoform X2 [Calidris pugnax]|uniref:tigger transposable element-derived protein 3-like isoform X2 n=1 Tax=Calidris pugnax TaxID=198806 RepID=UPI00071C7BD4|nr:PREDICTED: tigger transposable element-derived protein 3-like isoform X2 [Calidris pugnax]